MTDRNLDAMARKIFLTAINENRAGELLEALYDGGSATVDMMTGKLVIASAAMLEQLAGKARAASVETPAP